MQVVGEECVGIVVDQNINLVAEIFMVKQELSIATCIYGLHSEHMKFSTAQKLLSSRSNSVLQITVQLEHKAALSTVPLTASYVARAAEIQ